MVWSAYMGLLLSLEGVGAVLNLVNEVKGKALIRYFCTPCKPTKSNGNRINLPKHDMDKWALFMSIILGMLRWSWQLKATRKLPST